MECIRSPGQKGTKVIQSFLTTEPELEGILILDSWKKKTKRLEMTQNANIMIQFE